MPTPILDLSFQEATRTAGMTQSELGMLDECALKWNYRYNNLLERTDAFSWPLYVGNAWHAFQEKWRKAKGNYDISTYTPPIIDDEVLRNDKFEQQLDYWSEVLPAYQRTYARLYDLEAQHPWTIIEEHVTAEFEGFLLQGKIDLASDKPRFIRDFKSTSSAWLITPDGWSFKLQFMFYSWLMWKKNPKWATKPFDFQMDIMQRPGLRQTQKESWDGHIKRVCADIPTRPEFYFKRPTFTVTLDMLKRFEANVLRPKLARLELTEDESNLPIITNPNTNACNTYGKQCDFFIICEKGWSAGKHFFRNRLIKHVELE